LSPRKSHMDHGYFTVDDIRDIADSLWPARLVRNLSWAVAGASAEQRNRQVGFGSLAQNLKATPATFTDPDGSVSHGVVITRATQRHDYSVVDVCMRLHGCDTGSGDGIAHDERRTLIEWLGWRISTWIDGPDNQRQVDDAIRELAICVYSQALDADSDARDSE